MKHFPYFILLFLISCNQPKIEAEFLLTDPKKGVLFEKQPSVLFSKSAPQDVVIRLDESVTYQVMDGFGFTLSQGSAIHLLGMRPEPRNEILQELFGKGENSIGVSYLRLSVASSDLNQYPFSYHDIEEGEKDTLLVNFDLGPDRNDVIPVLKEIFTINPNIKLMASPWSPPSWMKDNKDTRGGKLLPEYYDRYALYLVKYIQQMAEEGFVIDALTIQNEPLHPGNNPSLLMLAGEQRDFIKFYLGPKFEENQIKTKILIYDHNADRPDYPISILDDPEAKKYIDGSAFHLYGGKIEALSEVHKAHPDKNLYFTEQWVGAPGNLPGDLAWHTKNLTIGASRNWAKTVLEWNLSSAPDLKPHTDRGGCDQCLGAITIKIDKVLRNPAYYVIAHASKYVLPGSIRIDSNEPEGLPNVAFKRPDGRLVLLILNESKEFKIFSVQNKEWSGDIALEAGAVATLLL
ncbi:glycoside hydrolase family 30 protein [Aquiflexum gelatinilyticum]|uniref:glycoside hydrolase family 30 protein n=1 Tax=Aquiflexum gelatinilyticum TaxID=2961943 RepID=UPI00216A688B|nr:glycoside hydrolase family 30 beta sandwich domain-containing protein [Aquiflexum gelatinilyticum]MCS4435405.1 glucosylceramidase [Aquiflexum gelatinilyticum]